jgi:hypothetical protein
MFSLGLNNAVAGHGLAGERSVGWRYMMQHASGIPTLEINAGSGGVHFGGITHGRLTESVHSAVLNAANDLELNGQFEPALLKVPALDLRVLWLRNISTSEDDNVIPIPSGHAEFRPGNKYSRVGFESTLRRLTASNVNTYDDASDLGDRSCS